MMKNIFAITLLLLLFPFNAIAHPPYFHPYSDWLIYKNEKYRLEGWYGDGVFTTDPVRVVLKHQNGSINAISPLAKTAAGFCPPLDYCWAFTFYFSGLLPQVWRLKPEKITHMLEPVTDPSNYKYGYPEDTDGIKEFGFDKSYNLLLWPVAWMKQTVNNVRPFVFILTLCLVLLTFNRTTKIQLSSNNTKSTRILYLLYKIVLRLISSVLVFILMFGVVFYAYGMTLLISIITAFILFYGMDLIYKKGRQ